MILYNDNDQLITLPGVRVGSTLIAGAALTASLKNKTTGEVVFNAQMQDAVGVAGSYTVQPPLFSVKAGTNYQMVYTGLVQGFKLTLDQDVEVRDRTR